MDGYYHCSCPGRPGTRLSSDRHSCEEIDMCEQDNGGCSHTCTSTHGQVNFFQLVSVVFLYMAEPLRHPYISDQVYCSCPTGEQLGDDWKTCRAPPQCPEVHTEIVFPDLQHFFFLFPGRLFEGRGVCAKMWGGGPMGGRHLCSRPRPRGRI